MFWTYNTTSPQIDIILCKDDLTLQELLDQENVLQELKAQNLKLVEFLIKPDVLRELVSLITTEPPQDSDLSEQYRYPNLACELLTSDLPALNERLASEEILNRLYQFLQNESPLNPLLSSYFSRTLSILISRKSEQNWFSYQYTCLQALEFLKAKEEFIQLLLKHMGTSSIMDLMLNLITLIEGPELKQSLWNWLQSQNVIPSLISLLGPNSDPDCQMNAAFLLCNIVQKLRENSVELNDKSTFDPILHLLESATVTKLVLTTVFNNDFQCDTSIQSGVDVLLILLQPHLPGDACCRQTLNYSVHDKLDTVLVISNNINNHTNNNNCNNTNGNKRNCYMIDSEDPNNRQQALPIEIIAAILPFVEKFKEILMNPPEKESTQQTSGITSSPFGKARLMIAKFMGALISLNSCGINEEIMRCDIPELLLELFYAYSSNNFLHTEVEKIIAYAIDHVNQYLNNENTENIFFVYLLKKCKLVERILDMWQENLEREGDGHPRKGYMGHVIRIATLIHNGMKGSLLMNELLTKEISSEAMNKWNAFVNDTLITVIELHSTCLGGVRPKLCQSNDNSFEESVSSKDLKSDNRDFGQDDDQNMMFSNDSTLMRYGEEGFRFSNGSLAEDEDERLEHQTKMFDLMCAQKWQSFNKGLDSLEENDEDGDTFQQCRWREIQSWDSDDENVEGNVSNTSDPWSKLGNVSDPWANNSSCNEESDDGWSPGATTNWANFDEKFSESFSSRNNSNGSANMDQFNLFNNDGNGSTFENVNVLKSFSNVTISSNALEKMNLQSQCENRAKLTDNDSWAVESNESEDKDKSEGYNIMQQKYDCFHDQNKDCFDAMLNLGSISGNTLAEKIANAENDLRNKDVEEQQQLHHRPQNDRSMNSFEEEMEQTSYNRDECDIRVPLSNSYDETLDDERVHEQNASFLSQPDCLTENSFDFFTAENSTSDAESSVEFADADNSLELEEDDLIVERPSFSPSNELVTPSADPVNRDQPSGNVGVQSGEEEVYVSFNNENEKQVEDEVLTGTGSVNSEENNTSANSKHGSLNGDVEGKKLEDCDDIDKISSSGCDSFGDQAETNIVIDEPA